MWQHESVDYRRDETAGMTVLRLEERWNLRKKKVGGLNETWVNTKIPA